MKTSLGLVMWDLWWTKWRWGRFLRVLRFPLPIFIPPIAPQSSSSIIWGFYNRPEVAAVPRDLVPPHQKKKDGNQIPHSGDISEHTGLPTQDMARRVRPTCMSIALDMQSNLNCDSIL
jgi:hypothetical protein